MNRRNIQQLLILFLVSTLLVAGMAKWLDMRNPATELLLNEEGEQLELDAPLSLESLQSDNQPVYNMGNPKAVFTTNKGTIELELFAEQMPVTVGNFVKLAEEGFYNGTKFHRVIEGFMIQGGDPNSKGDNMATYGQGGPGYTVQDEFVEGENLTNVRGSIAMANTGQPNSGGSQFFINVADNIGLDFNVPDPNDSKHPVFGHVITGMDVVDAIVTSETGQNNIPVEPIIIESVTIVRN